MTLIGSHQASGYRTSAGLRGAGSRLAARLIAYFKAMAEHALAQRLAGKVFAIRVASAVLAYGSQVLLARWMGSFEFGIYVYVWTWVLLIGQPLDLGLGIAAQRFIPEYREHKALGLLRGFLTGSRWVAVGVASAVAMLCAGAVRLLAPWLDDYMVTPLLIACISLPAYALANIQDGIARSHDWVGLSMVPTYVTRKILLTDLMAAAYFAHLPMNAVTAMIMSGTAIWLPTLGQLVVLNRRLHERVPGRSQGL